MAHIHALRDEYKLLSSHVLSKSPSSRGLLEDLVSSAYIMTLSELCIAAGTTNSQKC